MRYNENLTLHDNNVEEFTVKQNQCQPRKPICVLLLDMIRVSES